MCYCLFQTGWKKITCGFRLSVHTSSSFSYLIAGEYVDKHIWLCARVYAAELVLAAAVGRLPRQVRHTNAARNAAAFACRSQLRLVGGLNASDRSNLHFNKIFAIRFSSCFTNSFLTFRYNLKLWIFNIQNHAQSKDQDQNISLLKLRSRVLFN